VKDDADPMVREAAESMLKYLEGDTLLRASWPDGNELLRAASGEEPTTPGDELLRGTDTPKSAAPYKRNLLQRLRRNNGKPKDG
jgi:hypothetical protein